MSPPLKGARRPDRWFPNPAGHASPLGTCGVKVLGGAGVGMASELPRCENWSRSARDSGVWDSPKRGPGMAETGSGPGAVPQMPSPRVGAWSYPQPTSLVKRPGSGGSCPFLQGTPGGWLSWACRVGGASLQGCHHVCPQPRALHPESLLSSISLQRPVSSGPSQRGGATGERRGVGSVCPVPPASVSRPWLSPPGFRSRSPDSRQSPRFKSNHILTKYNGLLPNWQPN